jgi:excisionase family DNA binding protein
MVTTYITLTSLSHKSGLSKRALKELVNQKKIPALSIGNRLKFNTEAVEKALADLASKGDEQ